MRMTDLAFLPAHELAAMVRRREIGCVELLDHFMARVERLDNRINAVVVRDFERAREVARGLDQGPPPTGPLAGVPMTVKESFDLTGLPTTWGYTDRREHRAADDALAVQRLKAAGAVVFGKTNVPVSLADWQSFNPIYGTTSNPWNLEHTPGGSSGGGAAAVAAGLAALELGSDIGGSIRVPAHYCGLFGHKPTWGLCPTRGQSLVGAAAMTDISVIGPMARSAEDLALALAAIAGPDEAETALRTPLPPPRFDAIAGLKIAVWASEPGQATDEETIAAIEAVASFLEAEGARVDRHARPKFDPVEAYRVYLRLLYAAFSGRMTEAELASSREERAKLSPDNMSADAVMVRCVDGTHRSWLADNELRYKIRRVWGAFFHEWDVLLCPAIATPALPHVQEGATSERRITVNGREMPYNDMLFWPGITCGFHLPASVAPIALASSGLPIGVQIAGPIYGDRTTIEVARLLELNYRRFVAPPGWT